MYGLVNTAIEQLITRQFGGGVWERVANAANVSPHGFVSMEAYDDAITYDLVAAASKELDLSTDEILEAFGEYWILYTAEEGYGALMDLSGKTFEEFLRNLNTMHTRVALSYPELLPPSFRCESAENGRLELHYMSHRRGLDAMVKGLLNGLAKRFGIQISVEYRPSDGDESESVFSIAILE